MSPSPIASDFDYSELHPSVLPLIQEYEFLSHDRKHFPSKHETSHTIYPYWDPAQLMSDLRVTPSETRD